jgi:hypothetical protein
MNELNPSKTEYSFNLAMIGLLAALKTGRFYLLDEEGGGTELTLVNTFDNSECQVDWEQVAEALDQWKLIEKSDKIMEWKGMNYETWQLTGHGRDVLAGEVPFDVYFMGLFRPDEY